MKPIIIAASLFLLALAGCTTTHSDLESTGPLAPATPTAPAEFRGHATVTEVSACPTPTECVGAWEWSAVGAITASGDAIVVVSWDSPTGAIPLRVFVYEGDLGAYRVVAEAESVSPLSIAAELDAPSGGLQVGFTGTLPATVLVGQRVDWKATVWSELPTDAEEVTRRG